MLIEGYLNYEQFVLNETKKRECNSNIMEIKRSYSISFLLYLT